MTLRMSLVICAIAGLPADPLAAQDAAPKSPYVGAEHRRIKALSDDQVRGYLEGQGVALALPAELNHYPGPRHALDMADSLRLTGAQRRQIDSIATAMRREAISLGQQYVALEATLDSLFATRAITAPMLARQVGKSEAVSARLRFVHLEAHLAVRVVLTDAQAAAYDRLRGYGTGVPSAHAGHKP